MAKCGWMWTRILVGSVLDWTVGWKVCFCSGGPWKAYQYRPSVLNGKDRFEENERKVDAMLASLRRGERCEVSTVRHATYLCNVVGRQEEFALVAPDWFRRIKGELDDTTYFKAASYLCHLGKINRVTKGELLGRLGLEPVEYLVKRMTGIGLHRFNGQDVASALSGLTDLVKYCRGMDGWKGVGSFRDSLAGWMDAFQLYLSEKTAADPDWNCVVRELAPMALWYTNQIWNTTKVAESDSLRSILFRLCKRGFDEMAVDLEKDERARESCWPAPMVYADFCLVSGVDPDGVCPDSWRSWFHVYSLSLNHSGRATIHDFHWPLRLARSFPSFRLFVFLPGIHSWFASIQRYLLHTQCQSDEFRRYAVKVMYNLSSLVKLCSEEDGYSPSQASLRTVVTTLERAISSVPNATAVSPAQQHKMLTAFRDFRRVLEPDWFQPSQRFYQNLRDWCVHLRSGSCPVSQLSSQASSVASLLCWQRAPSFVMVELALTFYRGLPHLHHTQHNAPLATFGCACLRLNFDPSAEVTQSGPIPEDFWQRYLDTAQLFLLSCPKGSQVRRVLNILPAIAQRFERTREFGNIRPGYQQALARQWRYITPQDRAWLTSLLRQVGADWVNW